MQKSLSSKWQQQVNRDGYATSTCFRYSSKNGAIADMWWRPHFVPGGDLGRCSNACATAACNTRTFTGWIGPALPGALTRSPSRTARCGDGLCTARSGYVLNRGISLIAFALPIALRSATESPSCSRAFIWSSPK